MRSTMSSFAPKMAIYGGKSPIPSPAEVQLKLTRLVKRHEEMKVAYHRLKDQIDDGLLQAEEVFASLAIPLMKLVGLKTVQMAEEGRFTTIIVDTCFAHKSQEYGIGAESPVVPGDRNDQIGAVEGECCAAKVTMVGKELVDKQRIQLFHLVQLLKKIETEVNSSKDDILQTLDNHNASLYKLFQKAICYISELHGQNHDALWATLRLLQVIFKNVSAALDSVKDGVEDLMQDLSEQMCNPMVEYVKRLKDEIKNGTPLRLLAVVEEMERVMRDGRCELEDARKKVRVAEEKRFEALRKLEAANDRARKMKEHLKPLLEAKLLGMEEEQGTDDKLLWEMLKKKRKHHELDSPMGPKELLYSASKPDHKSLRVPNRRISIRPATRSATTAVRNLGPQTRSNTARIPLGPSPSVLTRSVASYKRITS